MAYSLKIMTDTWIKLSTDQGSKLPEDQKQFLVAGTVLPVANFEAVGADHVRLAFGHDGEGRQVVFKGRNTWFVYRPAVQMLREGKVISVGGEATSTYVLKATMDTWFKLRTLQSSALPRDQKEFIAAGRVIPISSYELVKDDHLKVALGLDNRGRQLVFQGRNTWYVYRPKVQILKDGKVLPLVSSSANTGRINGQGLFLLKSFEGLRLESYLDAVGVWTIGYGTTENIGPGMLITQAEAEALLKRDSAKFEAAIASLVKVALTDNQFSALVCFVYNIGAGAFGASTLLKLLNQQDYQGAADQLLLWNKGGDRVLAGLTRRRQAERALFLGQDFSAFL
jgi:GH24 family phage-related lysozyme (muramidase)